MMDFLNNDSGFCLAENLRSLRRRMKWSQEELADRIGLNRGNIASYENGTAEPKICNLVKFAHLFNISIFDLTHSNLNLETSYNQATQHHQNGLPPSSMDALGHFEREAEDYQQAIRGLQCLFRLKAKNSTELPEDVQHLKEQFEQLYGVSDQLLKSHLELIAIIKEKCGDRNQSKPDGESYPA
ncbi:MAG: helix-turn-helix transcriptional regulator [Bacteroidetes bacterium]|nr:helix-turn-helix transcriptional regulator [Bacteroidota bacterium]